MPKPLLTLCPSCHLNHSCWELNKAANFAIRPKLATWTWEGIVEMVHCNCRLPLFIEPLGAVDKATDPSRISNKYQDSWGVWYFSISALATLRQTDVVMHFYLRLAWPDSVQLVPCHEL